jgi:hypothetical protein
MEIIMVGYLPFSFPQELKILPIKTKKPTLGEWAEVSCCFFLQPRPSHEDVWPAKSIPKLVSKAVPQTRCRDFDGRRVGRANHELVFPLIRASVFRPSPNDNRIFSRGFYLCRTTEAR